MAYLFFFAAKNYGIIGALIITLTMSVFGDFLFFGCRNYKMGYINKKLMQQSLISWSIVVVLCSFFTWGCLFFIHKTIPEQLYLSKLVIGAFLFTLFYLTLMFALDNEMLGMIISLKNKLIYNPFTQKLKAVMIKKPA